MDDVPKRAFFDRVTPKLMALVNELQEEDGLRLDEIFDVFMSFAVGGAVACQGRDPTFARLGTVAADVMTGRFDGSVEISTG